MFSDRQQRGLVHSNLTKHSYVYPETPAWTGCLRTVLDEKPGFYAGVIRLTGRNRTGQDEQLFSNAEPAENHSQQIVRREFAGDFVQRILCETQLFR